MDTELKSRQEALASGDMYYQGKPCPHGHSGKRYTVKSTCVDCSVSSSHARYQERKTHAPGVFQGDVCRYGHDGKRDVRTGQCIECIEIRKLAKDPSRQAKKDIRLARNLAMEAGEAAYDGPPCKACGGTLRNAKNYHCIPCSRVACREGNRRRKFGITASDCEAMEVSQEGRCAICGGLPNGRGVLHVDHCHSTGVVRGLLCHSCNVMLGHCKDDLAILQAAIEYLKRYAAIAARQDHGGASQTS